MKFLGLGRKSKLRKMVEKAKDFYRRNHKPIKEKAKKFASTEQGKWVITIIGGLILKRLGIKSKPPK